MVLTRVQAGKTERELPRYIRVIVRRTAMFCICVFLIGMPVRAHAGPVIREEVAVTVAGVPEVWRLQWKGTPQPECAANDEGWFTCPCEGFAFGEAGNLELLRLRKGEVYDHVDLTSLFALEKFPRQQPKAVVQRWAPAPEDRTDPQSEELAEAVGERPVVRIMQIGDYNHDGEATEFFLQTDALPCGRAAGFVIGVSAPDRRLHAFGTALRPNHPLFLQRTEWVALRDSLSGFVRMRDWTCGDHGSPTETELEIAAKDGAIDATMREYQCTDDFSRGQTVKVRRL